MRLRDTTLDLCEALRCVLVVTLPLFKTFDNGCGVGARFDRVRVRFGRVRLDRRTELLTIRPDLALCFR